MSHLLLLLKLLLLQCFASGNDDVQELVEFVEHNGGNQVSIFSEGDRHDLVLKLKKALSSKSICVKSMAISKSNKEFRSPFNIAIVDSGKMLNESLALIGNFTARSFILYFPPIASWMNEQLPSLVAPHKLDLLFYTAIHSPGNSILWSYIFMFKELSQPIMNKLKFKRKRSRHNHIFIYEDCIQNILTSLKKSMTCME